MHIPIANQQLDATRLLAGQSFTLSTAQIAPSCWSLLWWIKWEYMGYILSISFCIFFTLEVMSFTFDSICNKITKSISIWQIRERPKPRATRYAKDWKNYAGTVLQPLFVNTLKLKITRTAQKHSVPALQKPKHCKCTWQWLSTRVLRFSQWSSYEIHSSEMWCCQ